MYKLREVEDGDLEALYDLSKLQNFINLPSNKSELKKIIKTSKQSFTNPSENLENNYYLFVLEIIENSKIIGASMVHGKHGSEEKPHFYLKVSREHKFSQTLNTGFIHGTLKFNLEPNGWSEIGGLVLDPNYRGHELKLGKALSFVRFLYIGLNKNKFTNKIHVELMPPLDKKGNSPLWEAIGRKFLNMEYQDADRLSQNNKEFILKLFPLDTIYETLLPMEARNAIGQVGESTLPVKSMLEKIGFHYTEEVDPFDGGPHYRAYTDEILPIKNICEAKVLITNKIDEVSNFLILDDSENFCTTLVQGKIINDELHLTDKYKQLTGKTISVLPLN